MENQNYSPIITLENLNTVYADIRQRFNDIGTVWHIKESFDWNTFLATISRDGAEQGDVYNITDADPEGMIGANYSAKMKISAGTEITVDNYLTYFNRLGATQDFANDTTAGLIKTFSTGDTPNADVTTSTSAINRGVKLDGHDRAYVTENIANENQYGLVTTINQTFKGEKKFKDQVNFDSGIVVIGTADVESLNAASLISTGPTIVSDETHASRLEVYDTLTVGEGENPLFTVTEGETASNQILKVTAGGASIVGNTTIKGSLAVEDNNISLTKSASGAAGKFIGELDKHFKLSIATDAETTDYLFNNLANKELIIAKSDPITLSLNNNSLAIGANNFTGTTENNTPTANGLVPAPERRAFSDDTTTKFLRETGWEVVTGKNIPLTGYVLPSTTSAIQAEDSVNTAFGKLQKDIDILNSGDTVSGSVSKKIKDAINELDVSPSENDYVVSIKQTDGKIEATTSTKGIVGPSSSEGSEKLVDGKTVHDFIMTKLGSYAGININNNFTSYQTFSFGGDVTSSTSISDTPTEGTLRVKGGIAATGGIKGSQVYNAVWNDLSDRIEVDILPEAGYAYAFDGNRYYKTNKYCDKYYIGIHSDTAGFEMGAKANAKYELNTSVAGFVLAYVDKSYKAGTPLTCTKEGKLTKIGLLQRVLHPERVVATFWKIEPNKTWGSEQKKVKVNGRMWIKIK